MKTEIINISKCTGSSKFNINDKIDRRLKKAAKSMMYGGIVVFPTETVYGIGADALNKEAVQKIFKIKNRNPANPLIVHIADKKKIDNYITGVNPIEKAIIDTFWPGPLTLILPKKDVIPNCVTAGLDTVAIRVPNNEIALKLIEYSSSPIAAPSANISGKPSGTKISDIWGELHGKVDYIIDDGSSDIGIESTVVQVIGNEIHILRPGKITKEDLEILGCKVVVYSEDYAKYNSSAKALSPGMKFKHYAPNTKCILVYSKDNKKMVSKVQEIVKKYKKPLIVAIEENMEAYRHYNTLCLGSQNKLKTVAKKLFSTLRKIDSYEADIAVIEGVSDEGIGLAIMNRLIRACNHNYFEV